jgi:chemotaxis signal transduction protein
MKAAAKRSHLIGSVGGRVVALELEHLAEVIPMLAIDPVPGGPAGLAGFIGLEGEPVPVFDLRTLFGLPRGDATLEQRIAIATPSGRPVGLIFDEVSGLGAVEACRSPRVEDKIVALEVVKAIGLSDGRVSVVLDPRVAVEWLTRFLAPAAPSVEGGAP